MGRTFENAMVPMKTSILNPFWLNIEHSYFIHFREKYFKNNLGPMYKTILDYKITVIG